MKILHNKKIPDQALMIASSDDDYKVLSELFDRNMVFGFWKLLSIAPSLETDVEVIALKAKFGNDLKGIGYLNIVDGFVPTQKEVGDALPF